MTFAKRFMPRLPRSANGRRAVLGLVTLAAAVWCNWYRPWETHYCGRPVSWWSARLRAEKEKWDDPEYGAPRPTKAERWLSSVLSPLGLIVEALPLDVLGMDGAMPVLLELLQCPDLETVAGAARYVPWHEDKAKDAVPLLVQAWRRFRADWKKFETVGKDNLDLDNPQHRALILRHKMAWMIIEVLGQIDYEAALEANRSP